MIVFGGKLLAPKKRDGDDGEHLLSSSQAQKGALKNLSKQEKLLLVELQKTRIEIVKELEKLDPAICNTTENWFEVRQTIDQYEHKLLVEGGLDSTTKKVSPTRAGTLRVGGATRGSTIGRAFSPSKSILGSTSSSISANSVSRIDLAKVPTKLSGFRTGIDTLPVLATSGDTAFEAGLKRQGIFKLPVFKLPAIDNSKFQSSIRKTSGFFDEGSAGGADFSTVSRDGMRSNKRYGDKIAFMTALISMHLDMPSDELQYVKWYLKIKNSDIEGIVQDLGIQLSVMKQQKRQQMLQAMTESDADEEAAAAAQQLLDESYDHRPLSKYGKSANELQVQSVSVFARAREIEIFRIQQSEPPPATLGMTQSSNIGTTMQFSSSSPNISPTSMQSSTMSFGNTLRTSSGGQPYAMSAAPSPFGGPGMAAHAGKNLRRFASLPEGLPGLAKHGAISSDPTTKKGLHETWAPNSNKPRPAPINTDFASMTAGSPFSISPKSFSPNGAPANPFLPSPQGAHLGSSLNTVSFVDTSVAGRGNLRSLSKQHRKSHAGLHGNSTYGVSPGVTQTLMQASVRSGKSANRKYAWQTLAPIAGKTGGSQQQEMSASQSLKLELLQSLRSMQQHTEMVKDDILSVQDLVAVGNAKAKKYMFAMAAERMAAVIEKLILKEYRRGWTAWIMEMRQEERWHLMTSYSKFQSLRHFAVVLGNLVHDAMRQKLVIWMAYTQKEVLRLRKISENSAAIQIQRVTRGYLARRRVEHIRERNKFQALYNATVKLQALFRGKITRWRYLRFRRSQLEDKSARLIQRVYRGYRGRKRVKAILRAKGRDQAATKIQSIVRMRQARVRVQALMLEHLKKKMAIKIQAVVRGFLARRSAEERRQNILRFFAAQKIQARVRGMIARNHLDRRRAEAEEYWAMQRKAATDIQRVYRGYRGRVKSRLHVMEINRRRKKIATAATKINNCARRFLARRLLQKMKKQQIAIWMDQARNWVEMWSEDQATWFYANMTTGESQWEPTKQGYTKADGRLVLANGSTVEDPRNFVIAPEDDENRYPQDVCAECSERLSIRSCNECGDHFCTICYKATHSTGTRRNHTFTMLGPIDCSECEALLAERMCISCDEAYCDGCWRKLHMRGKRRFHPFYEVWPNGKVGKIMMTIDGEQVEDYDATYTQQRIDSEAATAASPTTNWGTTAEGYTAGADQQQPVSEWSQAYDDQGYPYWYNYVTGVSQYEDPFQQQQASQGGELTTYDQSGYDQSGYDQSGYDQSAYDQSGYGYGDNTQVVSYDQADGQDQY